MNGQVDKPSVNSSSEFKLRLFSTNEESNPIDLARENDVEMPTKQTDRLERLISANVSVESANQRLILKQQQNLSIKTPISGANSSSAASTSSSASSSTVSSLSSATSFASSIQSIQSILNTLATPIPLLSEPVQHAVGKSSDIVGKTLVKKWTCMICLSKHPMDVRVCLICGSSSNTNSVDANSSIRSMLNSPKIGKKSNSKNVQGIFLSKNLIFVSALLKT